MHIDAMATSPVGAAELTRHTDPLISQSAAVGIHSAFHLPLPRISCLAL
jgi:hypothetical protein